MFTFSQFLKRQSGIVVLFDVNRPTMNKAEFLQHFLHHDIIPLRVDAHMAALLVSPVHAIGTDSLFRPVCCDPVARLVKGIRLC